MRIRRKDCEDAEDTDELLAHALTEDIAKWVYQWAGESRRIGLESMADIYELIRERQKMGVEI